MLGSGGSVSIIAMIPTDMLVRIPNATTADKKRRRNWTWRSPNHLPKLKKKIKSDSTVTVVYVLGFGGSSVGLSTSETVIMEILHALWY
jgi:hypothetical protein